MNNQKVINLIDIIGELSSNDQANDQNRAIEVKVTSYHGSQTFSRVISTMGELFNLFQIIWELFVDSPDEDSRYRIELVFGTVDPDGFRDESRLGCHRKDLAAVIEFVYHQCKALPTSIGNVGGSSNLVA